MNDRETTPEPLDCDARDEAPTARLDGCEVLICLDPATHRATIRRGACPPGTFDRFLTAIADQGSLTFEAEPPETVGAEHGAEAHVSNGAAERVEVASSGQGS